MRSQAAVFHATGRPLELISLEMPPLAAGEILIEIQFCTICGSDLHTIRGDRPVHGPTVLGHEIIGRVAAIGGELPIHDLRGEPLAVGDRITWSVACSCQTCFYCRHDLPQKCEHLFKYGHESVRNAAAPSGGLAEHCVLRAGTSIVKLPGHLVDAVACPANCATATVAAALRTAGEYHESTVLIVGAGMLGLTAAAWARDAGAAAVIVTDLNLQRCQRAQSFGATHAAVSGEELQQTIASVTEGRGVDVLLDMSGAPAAIEAAMTQVRIGGRVVLVGSVFPTRPIEIVPERMVRQMLRIEGVHNYTPRDLLAAVEFLERTHDIYPFAELVAAEYSLSTVNEAVAHALRGDALRVGIRAN